MKRLATLIVVMISFYGISQTPREIVQDQLEAYNAKDIDAFMKVFDEDAALYRYGSCDPSAEGSEELREIYSKLFEKSPQLNSEVISRTVIGNKVIDYELITGREGQTEPLKLVMIYEVKDRKIVKATSVR